MSINYYSSTEIKDLISDLKNYNREMSDRFQNLNETLYHVFLANRISYAVKYREDLKSSDILELKEIFDANFDKISANCNTTIKKVLQELRSVDYNTDNSFIAVDKYADFAKLIRFFNEKYLEATGFYK